MYTPRRMLFTAFICLFTAIILSQYASPISRWAKGLVTKTPLQKNHLAVPSSSSPSRPLSNPATSASSLAGNMTKTPVYFLSHGGPNIMEDHQHPAYAKLQEIGREITQKVRPKGVVVFSAHWQAGPSTIQVNTAEMTELIYDYYGFPPHYYDIKYPNVGNKALAESVITRIRTAGLQAQGVQRGLDHGVFAPFTVAFNPKTNPLNVPVVQVSLFDSDDAHAHYRLGEAVASLRDEGVLVIVSGMAVHNLRDMWRARAMPGPMPYTTSFDQALKDAVEQAPEVRRQVMAELLKRKDARQAHPSFEHLLPIHIGAGAAGEDLGRRLWTLEEGSMSWAQYRFGEVSAA